MEYFCFLQSFGIKQLVESFDEAGYLERVIKDKYFPHETVLTWLLSADAVSSYGSQSWKNI
jgi:hypothetical protein